MTCTLVFEKCLVVILLTSCLILRSSSVQVVDNLTQELSSVSPVQNWLLSVPGTWISVQHCRIHSSIYRYYESGSVMTRYLTLKIYCSLRRNSTLVHYALETSRFLVLMIYVRMTMIRLSEQTECKTSYKPISPECWGSSSQLQPIISVLKLAKSLRQCASSHYGSRQRIDLLTYYARTREKIPSTSKFRPEISCMLSECSLASCETLKAETYLRSYHCLCWQPLPWRFRSSK